MPSCVIDASAVFVDLQGEAGAVEARRWLRDAAISAVNLHEIVAKATEKGATPDQARELVGKLRLIVHPHDAEAAVEAGLLRAATRPKGLGLGDRACLALARRLGLPAVTADVAWVELAEALGVEVVMVRRGVGGT